MHSSSRGGGEPDTIGRLEVKVSKNVRYPRQRTDTPSARRRNGRTECSKVKVQERKRVT